MMRSEFYDPEPLPGERPVPSIKVDARKLLALLLRAEPMMTAVDRRRYANRAISAIEDVIRDFQIAHDFKDERATWLRKMWGDIAVFMDYMEIIGDTNAIHINITSPKKRKDSIEFVQYETMTPDQMKIELTRVMASLDEGATKWKKSLSKATKAKEQGHNRQQ